MKYQLRGYQLEAVNKMLWSLYLYGNDIVCAAQGSGKSLIIADFVFKVNKPVLILQPSKELLKQNLDKILSYVEKEDIGIFSASMNSKEIKKFTFGTIQSVYKHPELFKGFEIAIVDEADLVNPKKLSGMYNKFFKQAGIVKVYGLTGTPFRQDTFYKEPSEGWNAWKSRRWKNFANLEVVTTTKMINRYKEKFWDRLLYVINTHTLLERNYLTPLNYVDYTLLKHDEIPVNQSKSDFDLLAYEDLISSDEKDIVKKIELISTSHKSTIVYCSSIEQATRLSKTLKKASVISSNTPAKERDTSVASFKKGEIKILFNVSIFTVGFDHPELDSIVILRPTKSLRLHLQILGRGTRKANGKTSCDVYDFAGNVDSLGKLEDIKIEKVDGLWNVTSPTYKRGFHNAELYTYKVRLKPQGVSDMHTAIY